MLLLGLSGLAACWTTRPVPASSVPSVAAVAGGIDLREPAPSPTFNTTSAEKPPVPTAAPAPQPEPDRTTVEPLQLPPLPPAPPADVAPAPVLPMTAAQVEVQPPAPPEPPPAPPAAAVGPRNPAEGPPPLALSDRSMRPAAALAAPFGPGSLLCSCFHDLQRGDTPMMRNWSVLKLSSVLAVALAAPTVQANGPTEFGQDPEKLKEIEKKLDKLIETVTIIQKGNIADMKAVREALDYLKLGLDDTALKLAGAMGRIDALEKQVADLRAALSKLEKNKETTSFYPAEKVLDEIARRLASLELAIKNAPTTSLRPPTVGRIQLANMFQREVLFMINGKPFRVAPFSTVMLDNQPAGQFSYEVIASPWGVIRELTTPMLLPGDTYTITVR
jgi:hypothetical protein